MHFQEQKGKLRLTMFMNKFLEGFEYSPVSNFQAVRLSVLHTSIVAI